MPNYECWRLARLTLQGISQVYYQFPRRKAVAHISWSRSCYGWRLDLFLPMFLVMKSACCWVFTVPFGSV